MSAPRAERHSTSPQFPADAKSQAEYLLARALSDPEQCIHFLEKAPDFAPSLVSTVTRALTAQLPREVSTYFLLFLRQFLGLIRDQRCNFLRSRDKKSSDSIATEWAEDKSADEDADSSKTYTIWDFQKEIPECTLLSSGKKYIEQHVFKCYTCKLYGNLGVCLGCALKCHKDHDIVYSGVHSSFYCDCKVEGELVSQSDEEEEEQDPAELEDFRHQIPLQNILENNIFPIPNEILNNLDAGNDGPFLSFVNALGLAASRNNQNNIQLNHIQNVQPTRLNRLQQDLQLRARQHNAVPIGSQRQNQQSQQIAQTNVKKPIPKVKRQNQQPISAETALMMLKKFSSVSVLPPKPIVSRLSSEIDLTTIDLKKKSNDIPQNVHFKSTKIQLIQEPKNQITTRGPLFNYNCSSVVGNERNFIVVCVPKKIKVYDIAKFELIHELDINIDAIMIAVSPLDMSVFAIASLRDVFIYRIEENGQIELINKLELMLESIGNSIVIRSIEWVPFNLLHLAVTCTSFVKIYDIPTDCFSPIACITCNDNILSSFLAYYDEKTYVFVSTLKSRIYLQTFNPNEQNEPTQFRTLIQIPIQDKVFLSYNNDAQIVYFSASNGHLFTSRVQDLLTRPKNNFFNISNQKIGIFLKFVGAHPLIPSINFFRENATGRTVIVEYTNKGIAIWNVPLDIPKIALTDELNITSFATLFSNDAMFTLGSDGILYKLVSGKYHSEYLYKFSEQPFATKEEENGFDFHVPATFWINSKVERNSISITDEEGNNFSILLSPHSRDEPKIINRKKVTLNIQSTDQNTVIVGFVLTFITKNFTPETIKIFNRKYKVQDDMPRNFALPLKKSEVGIKTKYQIRLKSFGQKLGISRIYVYTINLLDAPFIETRHSFDLMGTSTSLTDFVDEEEIKCDNEIDFINTTISSLSYEKEQDNSVCESLLIEMYKTPSISVHCRKIVLKAFSHDYDNLVNIWANVIKMVCEKDLIHPSLVPILWRDFSTLPSAQQRFIGTVIWKYSSDSHSPFTLSSAFLV